MSGECLDAKAKFQMSDSLPHTRQEIENGRKSVVLSSSISLRRYFALEEHEPSQIYPHASGEGPQFMPPLTSVAGLVVARMEAELEDGRLHIVPFTLFLGRDVLRQLSGTHGFQLPGSEVSPLVPASHFGIWDAERSAFGRLRLIDLPSACVGDSHCAAVALVKQVSGLAALNAGEHAIHLKCPVAGRSFTLRYGSFVESMVGGSGAFHLHAGYEVRGLFLLVGGFGDVHAEALHLLLAFLSVFGIRVVRVLDTAGRSASCRGA